MPIRLLSTSEALSPTSKHILEKSVAAAENRRSTPELIDLSGMDSLDDLDDEAVWLFELTPKSDSSIPAEKESGTAIASERKEEKTAVDKTTTREFSALENVMDFAASMLKVLDPEPPSPVREKSLVPAAETNDTAQPAGAATTENGSTQSPPFPVDADNK